MSQYFAKYCGLVGLPWKPYIVDGVSKLYNIIESVAYLVLNELFLPINNEKKPIRVPHCDITSLKPSVFSYRVFRRFLVIKVALAKASRCDILD